MYHNQQEVNKLLGDEPRLEVRVHVKGHQIVIYRPIGDPEGQDVFFGQARMGLAVQIQGIPVPILTERLKLVHLPYNTVDSASARWLEIAQAEHKKFEQELTGPMIALP